MYVFTVSYQGARQDETGFRKLTGLRPSDFEALHEPFKKVWEDYFSNYTLEGKVRTRKASVRRNSIFANTQEALFFALVYFKGTVLQEELASQFNIDQPKASKYLFLMRRLLSETLKENQKILPKPKLERIKQAISVYATAC
ncbi:MAG: transposase family protein [Runella slithyformis]|nr:MAG: transposase family protein [Runella slithyformis]TAE94937.1 MAG: transposase family protein [Runella slithyformis]TAF29578.1 MAG: transposase family protein [Runella slithyformis]TAF48412.1 MAG: transposase family protein [Runella slithyformis]TAF83029.1 MAG: transposase family protein [Runella slithyformis]